MEDELQKKQLTVDSYGENESEDRRMTFDPDKILCVSAEKDDFTVRGRTIKKVKVYFENEWTIDLMVSYQGLNSLEEAVGTYFL